MRLPDFFIVGAPKCGTTALRSYLSAHPNVYMPNTGEPHFFSYDLPGRRDVLSEEKYMMLFANAGDETIVGEKSASYLFSEVAIGEIMKRNPEARMIAILRNPIDMAQAFHAERLYNLSEDVYDFEQAWSLQEVRRKGRCLPTHCREPQLLQYRRVCSFATQVERLFERVPASQRVVLIFEEFKTDPRATYAAILRFLHLPDDGRSEFPQVKANRVRRFGGLARWHRSAQRSIENTTWYKTAKRAANAVGLHPNSHLRRWNAATYPRPPLEPRFRQRLANELTPDVRRLERLLGRRLDCWTDFGLTDA